jgi:hypothetical protein
MTRDEAQETCSSLNGDLVSIHSYEEQNFITALMFDKPSAWISLEKKTKWTWIDDSPTSYTNWAPDYSGELWIATYCAYLLSSEIQAGKWVSSSCNLNNSAICQTDKSWSKKYIQIKN